jgi:hypothetical protein
MNRILGSAAVGAGAFVLLAGAAAGGYALHQAGTTTRTVTVTLTRTPPPKVVTKVKTRTVSAPPSIPCQDIGGSPEPGVITPGLPGDTTCTVTLTSPMGASHLAQIRLTTPGGHSSTWNLANPNG